MREVIINTRERNDRLQRENDQLRRQNSKLRRVLRQVRDMPLGLLHDEVAELIDGALGEAIP